ncbi:uncharacterized protein LOC144433950 [Glandiceps talaboti]
MMDLPSITDRHVRSVSPWAVPVERNMSPRVDKGTRRTGHTCDDGSLLDGSSRIVPGFFPSPVRDIRSPPRRALLSTQSCPADIQANELRTYSILNGGRNLESRESTKMRQRKRTGRREKPSLLSRLSEEAKEVMKEIREEMEREKLTKTAHISTMSESGDLLTTQASDLDNLDGHINLSESDAQTTVEQIHDDLDRSMSDNVIKRHKMSIVSSTGSATNSMTTESRSTVFTDSEREINGSTSDDRIPTPPDSTRASSGCRTSLLDNAIIEEEEYAINFDVQRNKFTTLTATPLVSPKPRLPRSYKRDQKTNQAKVGYSSVSNRLYNRGNRQTRRRGFNLSHPGEYTENRPYRKTPPVPSHILRKIRQVGEEESSTPSPTPSPPPPVQPRLYKERSFQVTGPGYDIRYHQPLNYNYHPQLNPVEKKLQTESVEKCRAWLDKWVISE